MGKVFKVLFATSEMVPLAKTGGLADVAYSLPKALRRRGHDVRVVMPFYRQVSASGADIERLGVYIHVPIKDNMVEAEICQCIVDGIPVYLIDKGEYYDREYLYGTPEGDYLDNAERFIFFCRVVLEVAEALEFKPDVLHCNDWQTGLVPVYVKKLYSSNPFWQDVATVFTIHNLAYQGLFWHLDYPMTGLPWELFTPEGLEFYGKINMLKAGIVFSDVINTVSKKYSKEIQTPEFGYGLDGVLRARSQDLYGILNGVDYEVWNPETDPFIAANYGPDKLGGKKECKKDLLREMGLKVDAECPVVGMVSRLAGQKGFDILSEVIDKIMQEDLYFVLLGTGEKKYHEIFEDVARRYPRKAGIRIAFDNALAHKIEAGADIFLMPSFYEPCGLNQMYSLKYGTVPVVRATGGLDDTIKNFNPKTGKGNGFKFKQYTGQALFLCLKRALEVYKDKKLWKQLMLNGMREDFSWDRSACEYEKLYKKARAKLGNTAVQKV